MKRFLRLAITLFLKALFLQALFIQTAAWAHKPSDSYLTLRATAGSNDITVRWDIALRDIDYVLSLDRDGNGEITWGEVRLRSEDISRLATSRLQLSSGDKDCALVTVAPLMLDKHSDGTYAVLSLSAQCASLTASLKAKYSLLFDVDPTHRGLVQWIAPGNTDAQAQALVFGNESGDQQLALKSPGPWEDRRAHV